MAAQVETPVPVVSCTDVELNMAPSQARCRGSSMAQAPLLQLLESYWYHLPIFMQKHSGEDRTNLAIQAEAEVFAPQTSPRKTCVVTNGRATTFTSGIDDTNNITR